jgi:hypothetical protein
MCGALCLQPCCRLVFACTDSHVWRPVLTAVVVLCSPAQTSRRCILIALEGHCGQKLEFWKHCLIEQFSWKESRV